MVMSLRQRSLIPIRQQLDEMGRFLESPFRMLPFRWSWQRVPSTDGGWAPSLCMWEKDDRFTVKLEIPGVKKDEVDISVVGTALTVRGERKAPEGVKEEEYECCEVCYGKFHRTIDLPSEIDADKIQAIHEDGVLEIQLPKTKKSQPVKIQIKAK